MKLGNLEITWLGHSSFLIEGKEVIYIDPYKINIIKKADIILITHSHYDHCSIEDLQKIVKDGTIIIMPGDCQSKFSRMNQKLIFKILEPGQEVIIDKIKIKAFPAYNINKNFHGKAEYWNGYIMSLEGKKIYHAGDTDLIPEMSQLAEEKLDLALLPVGGTYTMTAEEAMRAAVIIRAKSVVPMHYNTVVGSQEDGLRLKHLCEQEAISCIIPERK